MEPTARPSGINIRAIYITKALGFASILVTIWFLALFISPTTLALPITVVIVAVTLPTLVVALWPGEVPKWSLWCSFAADILAITTGVHFGGGVDQVSAPLLYTAVIGLAGLLLSGGSAFVVAGACALSYGALVGAEYIGWLPHLVAYSRPPDRQAATVVMVTLYLFLIAWVVSYAATQMRRTYARVEELRREAVSALSHDLKTPLTIIHGYSQMIESAGAADRSEYVQRIQHSVQGALDLIHNILDASAMEGRSLAPNLAPVNLNDLTEQVVDLYRPTIAAAGIRVATRLSPSVRVLDADRHLLARAIGNLVSNAIKYSSPGGLVAIQTEFSDGSLNVVVRDEGRGIPADEQDQLFEKYSRTPSGRFKEGTGLGLYIVRRIAEAHGGSIEVNSEPDKGSRFTLRLPLHPVR
jgi:signal transduction histidine kinase